MTEPERNKRRLLNLIINNKKEGTPTLSLPSSQRGTLRILEKEGLITYRDKEEKWYPADPNQEPVEIIEKQPFAPAMCSNERRDKARGERLHDGILFALNNGKDAKGILGRLWPGDVVILTKFHEIEVRATRSVNIRKLLLVYAPKVKKGKK